MPLVIVTQIDLIALSSNPSEIQAVYDPATGTVDVAKEDYYESGGICWSQMKLTKEDVDRLVRLFKMKEG